MAENTSEKLLDAIERRIDGGKLRAADIRELAEAYAWVMHPGQPHGGQVDVRTSS